MHGAGGRRPASSGSTASRSRDIRPGTPGGAAGRSASAGGRPRSAPERRKAAQHKHGRGMRVTHTHVTAARPRDARLIELCDCCGPARDGALNKPEFNASGAPYIEPKSMANFFSRGAGGALKAGKPAAPAYRAGASHAKPHPDAPRKRRVPRSRVFRASGRGGGLFGRETTLGPAAVDAASKPLREGLSSLKVGRPATPPLPPAPRATEKRQRSPTEAATARARVGGLKVGRAPASFFDVAMLDHDPLPPPPRKGRREPKWSPAGAGDRNFEAFPQHVADPYGLPGPPGAEARERGRFGICCVTGEKQTQKPVYWYKTKTGDVHRTRDLASAAAASGYVKEAERGAVRKLNLRTERVPHDTVVTYEWRT